MTQNGDRRRSSLGKLELYEQFLFFLPHPVRAHLGQRIHRRDTGFEVELPEVPGTGQHTFLNHAFVKGASSVGAGFIQGKELSLVAENSQTVAFYLHDDSLAFGKLID